MGSAWDKVDQGDLRRLAPAPIAWATYADHRYARELDGPDIGDAFPFRREVAQLRND